MTSPSLTHEPLSVVVPAFNEAARIPATLRRIHEYMTERGGAFEIIVVNDASRDATVDAVNALNLPGLRLISNDRNRGKGYSLKQGILAATHPLTLTTDADLATPIEEVDRMLPLCAEGFDIVIASRQMKESNITSFQPKYRRLMGKTFPLLVKLIVISDFEDTQCGFKLLRTEAARRIVSLQRVERFCYDVEWLYIAKRFGYRIREMPVTWHDQRGSTVRVLRDSSNMLMDLFRIRWNGLRGLYRDS